MYEMEIIQMIDIDKIIWFQIAVSRLIFSYFQSATCNGIIGWKIFPESSMPFGHSIIFDE